MQQPFAAAVDQVLRESPVAARVVSAGTERDGCFVSAPTLSQWRSGDAVPYLTEETLHRVLSVERWAGADAGRLVRTLYEVAGTERGAAWRWGRANGAPPAGPLALKAELESRGATNRCRSVLVTGADDYVIDGERRPHRSRHRQQVCAVTPGVDSVWTVFTVPDGGPADLVPVAGCSVGRTEQVEGPGYAVRAVQLRLDRTLGVGDRHRLEFAMWQPPHPTVDGELWPGWMRMVENPGCRHLELRIRFADTHRPNEAWQGTWRTGRDGVPEPDSQEPVTAADEGWFGLSRTNPRPGAYGFRWRWPGEREAAVPIGSGPRSAR